MATAQRELGHQAASVGEHAKEMASDAAAKAKDLAASATKSAGEAATFIGKKADDATSAVGAGMKSLAGTIREKTPDQGMVSAAGSAVANSLEAGGRYLQEQGLSGIGEDMTNIIRRNPVPAVLVAIGIGYLVARATTNRS